MAEKEVSASSSRALSMPMRPTITLPPRVSMESLFTAGPGASPGPMTLVSNFFSDVNDTDSECRSFSQLLAGAMASPAAFPAFRPSFPQRQHSVPQSTEDYSAIYNRDSGGGDFDFRFKQNRQSGFMISQPPTMFTVSPGLSPASLLDSPGFYLPGQVHFGMSHQQTLAQLTAHAQARGQFHVQAEYPSLSAAPSSQQAPYCTSSTTTQQHIQTSVPNNNNREEASEFPHSDQRSEPSSIPVDKITDDYNWRKYGQKQVKGSEYPRSYYKCTHPNCPVKKKVERSFDGQVTEIIYKGHHNHQSPKSNKRAKDVESSNGTLNLHGSSHLGPEGQIGKLGRSREGIPHALSLKNQEASQTQNEDLSGSSDGEEVGNAETVIDGKDEDEPESKKRNMVVGVPEPAPSHRTVTEPRIIVQTTSEVDLLDDGYRWRKYGQKVVKGNSYPRSYYKCTNPGCNVRKHVERAAIDPKAVITTYEGKHNHDVPAPRNSSHNTANRTASQL